MERWWTDDDPDSPPEQHGQADFRMHALDEAVRFRQPMRLFRAYEMHTRMLYWDQRAFYIEHRFEREGRVVATGYVCATLRSGEGVVPAATIIAATGQHVTRPEKPEIVSLLQAGEAGVQQLQRT